MFLEGPSFFVIFFLQWWSSGSAPARGRPDSVNDQVMTSKDYIKVEHVRT